ncbi:hypothetical protein AMECASPLE_037170 [Ameca splendens]|uniref:Uncharacterized protein n=1 Tax=Ameca splendens TaxID=208324 RepID=A0ABV0YW87_9TELE
MLKLTTGQGKRWVSVACLEVQPGESLFSLQKRSIPAQLPKLHLITVYTVPGMDSDWLIGEKGNQKGKVPVTYLELLS